MKNFFSSFLLLIIVLSISAQNYQSLKIKEEFDFFNKIMIDSYYFPHKRHYTDNFEMCIRDRYNTVITLGYAFTFPQK